jgi:CheY-like chemotaxis protein
MDKKILVVEDSESDRYLIKYLFEYGCPEVKITFKDTCLKAINTLGIEHFDFVLSDFRLGMIDAHPLLNILKNMNIEFAVFSGSDESEVRKELQDMKNLKFWSKGQINKIPQLVMEEIA